MGYKQCRRCLKFSIPNDAEEWEKICNLCYKRNLSERIDDIDTIKKYRI